MSERSVRLPRVHAGAVFDIDGTLVDSHGLHLAAYNDALSVLGIASVSWDDYREHCLRSSGKFEDLIFRRGIALDAAALYDAKLEQLRKLAYKLALRPGVRNLWLTLRQFGVRIALASAARRASVRAVVEQCGLPDFPDAIVCREDVGERTKPDPTCYMLAIQRLEAKPKATVAFEDAPTGVSATKAAGLFCFALTTTTFPRIELEAADIIFDSFEQLRVSIADDRIIVGL